MNCNFKALNFTDLTDSLFKDFNRTQEVKKCWRQENGEWLLKNIAFTEKWDAANYRFLTQCLQNTIKTGGTVYGAFDQEKLVGFASLENLFMGSRKQYLQMSAIHVSCEHRGHGIGKKLFQLICVKARQAGASKLYISAHSAEETQAFYQTLGCVDAEEIQIAPAAGEPCDRQLEYDLDQLIIRSERPSEARIVEDPVRDTESGAALPTPIFLGTGIIRPTVPADFETIYEIVNDAAAVYRGVIPADRWHEPYMPREELQEQIADGVAFYGYYVNDFLIGVMGIQDKGEVNLIRHAYVRTACRRFGIGGKLLEQLHAASGKTMLIGTWADAVWAIRFYEKHGFVRVAETARKNALLRKFWKIPARQVETSVVLTD